ncbi:hypothetical protein D3C76_1078630 [compost metagenome]
MAEPMAWLFRWLITSPGRRPIIAAGPSWTSLMTTPPLSSRAFFCSAVRSATETPRRLLLRSALPSAPVPMSASSSGSAPTLMSRFWRLPLRMISSLAFSPSLRLPTRCGRSADMTIGWPFMLRITSPTCRPPLAAGPFSSTWATRAPAGLSRPNDSARSLLTSWITTPSQPRLTLPSFFSWLETSIATSIGMANDSPMKPPERVKICELIPTTSPFMLNSGPPELPGLMATSVWMNGT